MLETEVEIHDHVSTLCRLLYSELNSVLWFIEGLEFFDLAIRKFHRRKFARIYLAMADTGGK